MNFLGKRPWTSEVMGVATGVMPNPATRCQSCDSLEAGAAQEFLKIFPELDAPDDSTQSEAYQGKAGRRVFVRSSGAGPHPLARVLQKAYWSDALDAVWGGSVPENFFCEKFDAPDDPTPFEVF